MNGYDFDQTIYRGDSTVDFYLYCLRKRPAVLLALPVQLKAMIAYKLKHYDKTQMKQGFYSFLRYVKADEAFVNEFWDSHMDRIQPWYLAQKRADDLIISASPEFLLRPACERIGAGMLIASPVERASGKCTGQNCRGEEKVRRFHLWKPAMMLEAFYSDSLSDAPMAAVSQNAYLVHGSEIHPWPEAQEK